MVWAEERRGRREKMAAESFMVAVDVYWLPVFGL
jgi:hypothetical protein